MRRKELEGGFLKVAHLNTWVLALCVLTPTRLSNYQFLVTFVACHVCAQPEQLPQGPAPTRLHDPSFHSGQGPLGQSRCWT